MRVSRICWSKPTGWSLSRSPVRDGSTRTLTYDVEARTDGPVTREQMRGMLQRLLAERFQIASHREQKTVRAHMLEVDRGGFKAPPRMTKGFHADIKELVRLISVQLTIPAISDPTRPSMASGPPVPVIDNTGLTGTYDFRVDTAPEPGVDMFEVWQRRLHEVGLRLNSRQMGATISGGGPRGEGPDRELRGEIVETSHLRWFIGRGAGEGTGGQQSSRVEQRRASRPLDGYIRAGLPDIRGAGIDAAAVRRGGFRGQPGRRDRDQETGSSSGAPGRISCWSSDWWPEKGVRPP